jgi:hypothetical protein
LYELLNKAGGRIRTIRVNGQRLINVPSLLEYLDGFDTELPSQSEHHRPRKAKVQPEQQKKPPERAEGLSLCEPLQLENGLPTQPL